MNLYGYEIKRDADLMHHGIKGMHWGVRRYQNEDGTWTAAGKERYGGDDRVASARAEYRAAKKEYNKSFNNAYNHNHPYSLSKKKREESQQRWNDAADKAEKLKAARKEYKASKFEKKIGKFESKVDKFNAKTMAAREKQLSKLEKKGSTNEKIADFNEGTKYVKAGQDRVKDVIANYKNAKVTAIKDSSYKKSLEYRQAVARFNEVSGNLPIATLGYAMEEAGKRYEK